MRRVERLRLEEFEGSDLKSSVAALERLTVRKAINTKDQCTNFILDRCLKMGNGGNTD